MFQELLAVDQLLQVLEWFSVFRMFRVFSAQCYRWTLCNWLIVCSQGKLHHVAAEFVGVHAYVCTCMYACMRTCVHAYEYVHMCMCIPVFVYVVWFTSPWLCRFPCERGFIHTDSSVSHVNVCLSTLLLSTLLLWSHLCLCSDKF